MRTGDILAHLHFEMRDSSHRLLAPVIDRTRAGWMDSSEFRSQNIAVRPLTISVDRRSIRNHANGLTSRSSSTRAGTLWGEWNHPTVESGKIKRNREARTPTRPQRTIEERDAAQCRKTSGFQFHAVKKSPCEECDAGPRCPARQTGKTGHGMKKTIWPGSPSGTPNHRREKPSERNA